MAHELVSNGLSALYHTLLARLHIQNENYDEAEENLNQALKLDHQVRISGMHRDIGMHIDTGMHRDIGMHRDTENCCVSSYVSTIPDSFL